MTLDEGARDRLQRLAEAHPDETPGGLAARLGGRAAGVSPKKVYQAAVLALREEGGR